MTSRSMQALLQVIGHADGVGDDRQGRIDRGAGAEEAAVDDVEIVDLVAAAIDVERRAFWVVSETHGAVLMSSAGDGEAFAKIGLAGHQMRLLATDMPE